MIKKQRLQHRIELDSLKIERVMSEHDFDGKIVEGHARQKDGELSIQFDVAATVQEGVNRFKALKNDLIKTFSPKQISIQTDGQGRIRLSYQPAADGLASLLDLLARGHSTAPWSAIVGHLPDGNPLSIDLSDRETHHLGIFGGRKSGKSHLMRSIVLSLALLNRPARLQFVLAGNPYNGQADHAGLKPLSYLPHMAYPFIETANELAGGLAFVAEEISYRLADKITTPRIAVVIDDLTLMVHAAGQAEQEQLIQIGRDGPKTGVHLIFSAADPENPRLHDLMDAFVPSRLVGRVDTPYQAEIATNALDSGAERLQGRGDHLAAVGDHLIPFQAAVVSDADLKTCLGALYHAPRARVVAHPFDDYARPVPTAEDELETIEVYVQMTADEVEVEPEEDHFVPAILRPAKEQSHDPTGPGVPPASIEVETDDWAVVSKNEISDAKEEGESFFEPDAGSRIEAYPEVEPVPDTENAQLEDDFSEEDGLPEIEDSADTIWQPLSEDESESNRPELFPDPEIEDETGEEPWLIGMLDLSEEPNSSTKESEIVDEAAAGQPAEIIPEKERNDKKRHDVKNRAGEKGPGEKMDHRAWANFFEINSPPQGIIKRLKNVKPKNPVPAPANPEAKIKRVPFTDDEAPADPKPEIKRIPFTVDEKPAAETEESPDESNGDPVSHEEEIVELEYLPLEDEYYDDDF